MLDTIGFWFSLINAGFYLLFSIFVVKVALKYNPEKDSSDKPYKLRNMILGLVIILPVNVFVIAFGVYRIYSSFGSGSIPYLSLSFIIMALGTFVIVVKRLNWFFRKGGMQKAHLDH